MGKRQAHEYTAEQRSAICDALNVLLWKCTVDTATFLKVIAPPRLLRSLHVEIVWDEGQEEFRCR